MKVCQKLIKINENLPELPLILKTNQLSYFLHRNKHFLQLINEQTTNPIPLHNA